MSNSEDVFTGFFNDHGWVLFDRAEDLSRMEFSKGDTHLKVMIKDGEMGIWSFKWKDGHHSRLNRGARGGEEVGFKRFSKRFADPEFFDKLGLALEKLW